MGLTPVGRTQIPFFFFFSNMPVLLAEKIPPLSTHFPFQMMMI